MKKINKNMNIRPSSLLSRRKPYQNALTKVLNAQCWPANASSLYSAESVKEELDSIYNGKCAFCENKPVGSPPQVEHYRPKDGIKYITHTGYYWLAYEWSNLLLACGNCNNAKGTNFPITNAQGRVHGPVLLAGGKIDEKQNLIFNNPLANELPILINPEIKNPAKHLFFAPNGELVGLTNEGSESIIIYDLNRDELYINGRKKKRDDIERLLLTRLKRYINGKRNANDVLDDLTDIIEENIVRPILLNDSFSEYFKQMLYSFDDFFIIGNKRASILLRFAFLRVIKRL
jgi:5-methylcytosine-specific restriction endonuclease McrA